MTQPISRKEFLKTGALALTLPLLSRNISFAKPPKNIGLQLYTLRNLMGKEPKETLKKVAAIGYTELETLPNIDINIKSGNSMFRISCNKNK